MLLVTDNLAERLLNRRKTESFGALTLRREFMKTLLHFHTHDGGFFHGHPFHSAFALIASFVLAMLFVLLFAVTVH